MDRMLVRFLLTPAVLVLAFSGASARSAPAAITDQRIGTLSGKFGSCNGVAINAAGQVTGATDMPAGNRHAFRWLAGAMTDLGTLGGGYSGASAINALGHVVGSSTTDSTDLVSHAFFWNGSTMIDLGVVAGFATGTYYATAINASDVVVGTYYSADYSIQKAFRWTAAGGIKFLPGLGGAYTAVSSINSSGVMVGSSISTTGAFRPVQWSAAGKITELPGGDGSALKINDSGVILGNSDPGIGTDQAAVWIKGKITYLGSLAGPMSSSQAADLNAKGHVVGTSSVSYVHYWTNRHAFFWSAETGMRDIGSFHGANSDALALNDSDKVVGTSETMNVSGEMQPDFASPWNAFVWDPASGPMKSLGTLGNSSYGVGLNNSGQMIGTAESPMGTRTFLCTTPGTLTDLRTLAGGRSAGLALNDLNEVVGESVGEDRLYHGFFWSASLGMIDLGTTGARHARAIDINNLGEVIVQTGTQLPDGERPFYWSRTTHQHIDIPGLGGERWEVTDINNHGQVAGNSFLANGDFHAMLWTKTGGSIDLDGVVGSYSYASAINDDGTVVGWHGPAGSGELRAFQWKPGVGMKDLPTLGGTMMFGWKINNRGDVAGTAPDASGGPQVFLYKGNLQGLGNLGSGEMMVRGLNSSRMVVGQGWTEMSEYHAFAGSAAPLRDLGKLPDHTYSDARAVNDANEVVGVSGQYSSSDPSWRAFIVRGSGAMTELTTTTGGYCEAVAINIAGQAVGTSTTTAGGHEATVWTTR